MRCELWAPCAPVQLLVPSRPFVKYLLLNPWMRVSGPTVARSSVPGVSRRAAELVVIDRLSDYTRAMV